MNVGALLDAGRWCRNLEMGFCGGGMCGMICISYKIYPFIWFLFASMSEAFFQKIFIKTVYRVSEVFG